MATTRTTPTITRLEAQFSGVQAVNNALQMCYLNNAMIRLKARPVQPWTIEVTAAILDSARVRVNSMLPVLERVTDIIALIVGSNVAS